ncbi:dihydrolipoamide acetyltransferase family protein [Agrobacterium vitis]|uniref:Dihydrolipoamide acetyltransferase component of pyruvate dehydrogenase complex n=1 Tax=Agrobacterium vitis TaxID=373 RepID=A0A7K1RFS5_AGRVI|nr:dihydrolipoamide acetyltransferase family protein [Agrobacterium vitis]MVA56843.1 2-oxo acid dehydrogenase subunit E2 [Agrobacterium vitis]
MTILSMKLPDIGEGITEVELLEWNVAVGVTVREDDIIASVMTEKATVEIPSLYEGRILALACRPGESVAVGASLVSIEVVDDIAASLTAPQLAALPEVADTSKPGNATYMVAVDDSGSHHKANDPASKKSAVVPANASAPRPEGELPLASPSVRARARDAGIDLRGVAGTGPAGRISHEDLDRVFQLVGSCTAEALPIKERRRNGEEKIKLVGLRRRIADRMSLANSLIAHITIVEEVDVTSLEELRSKLNADKGDKPKLTMLPFLTAALSKALAEHPEMNAHLDDDASYVTRFSALHVGIATMTEAGLVVPVLRHAEALDLYETAAEIARLAEVARAGKSRREELSGSTFTITSLGALGAIATTPIINHPEVAILGINKMAVRPMWDGQQFIPKTIMNISASFDHRVIDGWDAARFVQRMKSLLEVPATIFIGR